jgi:hypothetical protein
MKGAVNGEIVRATSQAAQHFLNMRVAVQVAKSPPPIRGGAWIEDRWFCSAK